MFGRVVIVVLLVAGFAAVGCGDDGDAQNPPSPKPAKAQTEDPPKAPSPDPPAEPADDQSAAATQNATVDWGPKRDRKRIVAVFAGMQRDFIAGRMGAVCKHVLQFAIEQFTPGRTAPGAPCPAKLRAFAAELQRRGVQPMRLRLLSARVYPLINSVWVEAPDGGRIRVPFGDYDQTGMKFELGTFEYPETLYGSLAGAAAYLRR
ncbi:MAG TPA: hypothetical protein VNO82_07825 [Solirubrobacteraceae bacterium]|nr:hypothetical protein [Solirubrobacteraceae bacterium]